MIEEDGKQKIEDDEVLNTNKNKLAHGYVNYLNFFAKLKEKEKHLCEKWVRNHFR